MNNKRPIFKCTGQNTDENCIKMYQDNSNFYFYDTPQDGNCLYNTLSLYYTHVKKEPITHIELRKKIIDYMLSSFNYREQAIEEKDVRMLYGNRVWDSEAGDLTLAVAQQSLGVYINLYNIERNKNIIQIVTSFYPELDNRRINKDVISILRIHRGHFGLLLPKDIQIPENVILIKNNIRKFIGNPLSASIISDEHLYKERNDGRIQCLICNKPMTKNNWEPHTTTGIHIKSFNNKYGNSNKSPEKSPESPEKSNNESPENIVPYNSDTLYESIGNKIHCKICDQDMAQSTWKSSHKNSKKHTDNYNKYREEYSRTRKKEKISNKTPKRNKSPNKTPKRNKSPNKTMKRNKSPNKTMKRNKSPNKTMKRPNTNVNIKQKEIDDIVFEYKKTKDKNLAIGQLQSIGLNKNTISLYL